MIVPETRGYGSTNFLSTKPLGGANRLPWRSTRAALMDALNRMARSQSKSKAPGNVSVTPRGRSWSAAAAAFISPASSS